MNKLLSFGLLNKLGDLPYIDKSCGIVQVVEMPVSNGGETVYKKIPVSAMATAEECSASNITNIEMIPNSKLKGMLYFEDRGITLGVRRGSSQQYRSELRLVCWLNTANITYAFADNGVKIPDPFYITKVMNEIIQLLTPRKGVTISYPYFNVGVVVNRIPEANAQIFAPYDYDEKRTQFLFPPYDFFAIDLTVTFELASGCIPERDPAGPMPC